MLALKLLFVYFLNYFEISRCLACWVHHFCFSLSRFSTFVLFHSWFEDWATGMLMWPVSPSGALLDLKVFCETKYWIFFRTWAFFKKLLIFYVGPLWDWILG